LEFIEIKMPHQKFPTISKTALNKVVRKIKFVKGVSLGSFIANRGESAAAFLMRHSSDIGPLDPGWGDDLITRLGFSFNYNSENDARFGHREGYCFYKHRGRVFLAYKDNCYGEDYTRVSVNWAIELSPEERGLVL